MKRALAGWIITTAVGLFTAPSAPAQIVFGTTSNSGPQKLIALDAKTGVTTTVMSGFNQLGGLAFDPSGNLYIAEQDSVGSQFHITKFNRGATPYSFANAGVVRSGITKPLSSYGVCMVIDNSFNLFAGRFFDPQRGNGVTEYLAGGGTRDFGVPSAGIPTQLNISYPGGTERLYVADGGGNRIMYTPDPLANSALGMFVHLPGVTGVTSDTLGNVLAVTSGANGVQKYDSAAHPLGLYSPQPGASIAYDPITGASFLNDVSLYRIPPGGGAVTNLTPNGAGLWSSVQFIAVEPPMFRLQALEPTAAVPEPSSFLLIGAGLAGVLGYARRRGNRPQSIPAGRQ